MKKHMVIEIGTNSIKALYAEFRDSDWRILSHEVYPARLGEGLNQSGIISAPAMERNLEAIEQIIAEMPVRENTTVHVIATEGLRKADNAEEFVIALQSRLHLAVEILSGETEARFSYLAATHQQERIGKVSCVLDIGGGSTEFALGKDGELIQQNSFSLGAVRLTEQFILHDPPAETELHLMQDFAAMSLSGLDFDCKAEELIAVGGSVTTLARLSGYGTSYVSRSNAEINGMQLKLAEVQKLKNLFSQMTHKGISAIPGMPRGRADIILAGAVILEAVMLRLDFQEAIVSNKGVRYGYLYSLA